MSKKWAEKIKLGPVTMADEVDLTPTAGAADCRRAGELGRRSMDNIIWGVAATLGVVFIVFVWEFARSAYLFADAAKWYGTGTGN